MRYKTNVLNKIFIIVNSIILISIAFLMMYPFINALSLSFSGPEEVISGEVTLYPRNFNIEAYKTVIKFSDLLLAYKNTIIYTVLGTIITLIIAALTAYPLVRGKLPGRRIFNLLIVITMFIPVGIIPNFLIIKELGLIDTIWSIVLPPCFFGFNIILMRTGFKNIPDSIFESAYIDGASEWRILFQIATPLSKATFAVVGLFAAIFQWNYFLGPLLYLNEPNLFPLTLLLRRVLLQSGTSPEMALMVSKMENIGVSELAVGPGFVIAMKMAMTMLAIGPIILLYPFVQRYFIKGAMMGSVKE